MTNRKDSSLAIMAIAIAIGSGMGYQRQARYEPEPQSLESAHESIDKAVQKRLRKAAKLRQIELRAKP